MRFGCSPIPASAQPKRTGALRECALNTRPDGVLLFELHGGLPLASCLQGLPFRLWTHGQRPMHGARAGAMMRADTAIAGTKGHLHDQVPMSVLGRSPTPTGFPRWTDGLLLAPTNRKLVQRKGCWRGR